MEDGSSLLSQEVTQSYDRRRETSRSGGSSGTGRRSGGGSSSSGGSSRGGSSSSSGQTRNNVGETGLNFIVVGNPGVGKSTILNGLVGSAKFESGVSFFGGLTSKL